MPLVRFAWSPILVDLRREVCPRARWIAPRKAWDMSEAEAAGFLKAGHTRLDCSRSAARIAVDDTLWIIGFANGAPRQMDRATAAAPGLNVTAESARSTVSAS